MSLVRAALAAAAAACALGATAYAQPTYDNGPPPGGAPVQGAPADQPMAPNGPGDGSMAGPDDRSATGAGANASVTVNAQGQQVIASQPVPDTPQNRAQYGQPMSRAGKMTKPVGD